MPNSILILFAAFFLSGCTAAAITAGGAAGLASAQEGGLSRAYHDLRIQAEINEAWFAYNVDAFSQLDMTVSQGRVLLTGVVDNPEFRVEAVRLAWQPDGVQQVINEVRVADSRGFTSFAKDTWITTRLRSAITIDDEVQSINYSIDTVNGTVYLLGIAQSQAELDKVVSTARKIPAVNQVVSYVKLVGELTPSSKPEWGDDVSFNAPPPVNDYSGNNFYQEPMIGQTNYNTIESAAGQPQPLIDAQSPFAQTPTNVQRNDIQQEALPAIKGGEQIGDETVYWSRN